MAAPDVVGGAEARPADAAAAMGVGAGLGREERRQRRADEEVGAAGEEKVATVHGRVRVDAVQAVWVMAKA